MGSDHAGASCWSKQTQNQKWVNRTRHQFRSPSARPVWERFLSFYFLCSNPVIEPVHHFPLSLEGKLVSAVEKQRVEPLRLADRLIGLTQAVNGSLNPSGGNKLSCFPLTTRRALGLANEPISGLSKY